jgi:nucleoside-diphosphate-sugar epimerase
MKNILITGGNGYIAKSIHSSLSSKYDITTVTRQDFDLTCWASTYKFFYDKTFDVVIHTATSGGSRLKEETDLVIRENLLMYRNLLNHQDKFTKFISFGSGAELNNPTTPYGISKQMIADSMFSKPNFLNLRIFAVFDENELDTRFIKANIQRYINREDMVIHEDKQMDFFYMEDLISLLDYHLKREEWLYNELDCVYMEKVNLTDIANMINDLSDYKVGVELGINKGNPYIGTWRGLPIKLVGLEKGIKNTYNKLKNEL